MGDFNWHVVGHIDEFDGFHGGYGVGLRNLEGRMLEFCLENELCVSSKWLKREEKRKVTFTIGENVTEIDFVFIKKHAKCEGNPWRVSTFISGERYR